MGPNWFVFIMRVLAVIIVIVIIALTLYFIVGLFIGPETNQASAVLHTINSGHLVL